MSLLGSVDVISFAIARLRSSLVSRFGVLFPVTGFVGLDMGLDPHAKRHCSLLKMPTDLESSIDL
jgi:hypothetical protein